MNIRIVALILTLAGLCYGIWHFKADADSLQAEMTSLKNRQVEELAAKEEEFRKAMSEQNDKHRKEMLGLMEDHEKKLGTLRQTQRTQMANAYKEFENIFAGNKKTIEYINLLEGKVRNGQALSKIEVEKLATITSGIGFLQKQYQRPLQEFTALQNYFETEANKVSEKPKANFGFFKRMFSKEFREAEKEYYREEGARRAFVQAKGKFETVYASAQKSMRAVNMDADAQLKKLYELIEDKRHANAEDLTGFFEKARQALRTHQDVLDFEPEPVQQPQRVQP